MKHRIPPDGMDELLEKLEDDYVKAVKNNESKSIEEFIEQFLYDSWTYNEQNMQNIKIVLSRYTSGEIYQGTLSESFNIMVDHLRVRLEELDQEMRYPVLHSKHGASLLVAFVDGLVLQYYIGTYSADKLRELTPYLKNIILQALKTEGDL
ncbi:hypothetical protein IUJ58_25955 (plasmid) [Priestia aryabhattai]|uniref:hypothetical protein n=1 Tax=Priestia aryabhattai TaxID=412384 RepID=UPI00237955C0|nr:hypothetical protein [Priestia aryabhattai]WDL89798.1 hypothetical protein IUJ58_25955 [Priestia aryabhattai]